MSTKAASATAGQASLWIGAGLVFAWMAMAWTALFFFAARHRPAEVPLSAQTTR